MHRGSRLRSSHIRRGPTPEDPPRLSLGRSKRCAVNLQHGQKVARYSGLLNQFSPCGDFQGSSIGHSECSAAWWVAERGSCHRRMGSPGIGRTLQNWWRSRPSMRRLHRPEGTRLPRRLGLLRERARTPRPVLVGPWREGPSRRGRSTPTHLARAEIALPYTGGA